MTRYDILIATRPHRHELLCKLLAELDRQMLPGAGALLYRDNEEASYGKACQTLLEASEADYVAFLDDDDWVSPDYIKLTLAALDSGPDYVGWPFLYVKDGVLQGIVVYSLHDRRAEYPVQCLGPGDVGHKNPIRRELALLGEWSGQWAADSRWAEQVRATGRVRTEAWVNEPMYHYRESSQDGALTSWQPVPEPLPVIPSYSWLRELDHEA